MFHTIRISNHAQDVRPGHFRLYVKAPNCMKILPGPTSTSREMTQGKKIMTLTTPTEWKYWYDELFKGFSIYSSIQKEAGNLKG